MKLEKYLLDEDNANIEHEMMKPKVMQEPEPKKLHHEILAEKKAQK